MHTIRVLYVEDDRADQELTRRHLDQHARHLKLQVVDTVADALDELTAGGVDVVLSDYRLPDGTGLDLLESIKTRGMPVPVVLVTRSGDAEAAVRLLKAGAANYVAKRADYLVTLPGVIEDAFRWFESTTELRRRATRLLYVESDANDVELTRRALHEHGRHLQLDVAWRGGEGLERLRRVPYDLVLLDYRLPDRSGIEVLKTIREEGIRVPVVVVTGQGDEGTAVQAFKLGAADYVIKREGYLVKLPSTLEHVLAQRRLADEKDALVVLNGLAHQLAVVRDVDHLVGRVTRAAADLLRADRAVLWLLDGAALRAAGWAGVEESRARAVRLEMDERARVRALTDRRVILQDLVAAPGDVTALADLAGPILAVSLGAAGRVIGILAVMSVRPREFWAEEGRLLTALADHAGVAIQNARLYQELSQRLDELHRTQEQLLQTEKIAAMGQLLAGVAHELNNPLSVVAGRAALLRYEIGDTPAGKHVEDLERAAERCARIVTNFLALARQRPPERQAFSLNQIVREAVELLSYQVRVDNVDIAFDLHKGLPLVWGDPHQVHQVVVNLVTNADHAMREVPPPRRLRLSTRFDAATKHAVLEVADTGPGIPAAIQARIFEPFFTTKPLGVGTGLGLALCQGIIEGNGGSMRFESAPGHGATFSFTVPVAGSLGETVATPALDSSEPVRDKSILVVDDEPTIGWLLGDVLALDGHHVDVAANGRIALDKLGARAYDLVLTDLRMPELDGPGLYREMERRYPDLRRRVIFITGDTLSPGARRFLDETGVPCVNKPFALDKVLHAVRQALKAAIPGES